MLRAHAICHLCPDIQCSCKPYLPPVHNLPHCRLRYYTMHLAYQITQKLSLAISTLSFQRHPNSRGVIAVFLKSVAVLHAHIKSNANIAYKLPSPLLSKTVAVLLFSTGRPLFPGSKPRSLASPASVSSRRAPIS